MKKNILAYSRIACTGCGTCVASCPKKAIGLNVSEDGFLAPVIDDDLCVDCGICQKVCYRFINPASQACVMWDKMVYGAFSSDQGIQQTTTSGGFAHELSLWGIEHGLSLIHI